MTALGSNRTTAAFVALVLGLWSSHNSAYADDSGDRISLAGRWAFRLDPEDEGIDGQWYRQELPDAIQLPGSLQEQGFGHDVTVDTQWIGGITDRSWFESPRYAPYRKAGNVKVPFWLQPEKHYVGATWYQRQLTIPEAWQGKRILLSLERCHWGTTVWADDKKVGTDNSLSTSHVYDLTFGTWPKRITIQVDNRMLVGVGVNAHSVTDHTQSSWNGIVGAIEVQATDRVWINDLQVFPDVSAKSAKVRLQIGNLTGSSGAGTLTLDAVAYNSDTPHDPPAVRFPVQFSPETRSSVELVYPLGDDCRLWDEFQPALYRIRADLSSTTREMQHHATRTVTCGMREFLTNGTQFAVNDRRVFLRGTLECAVFPLTGYPPADTDEWRRIIRRCKAHGLNHIRFHSWCPPRAAFMAADELGFYFQVECAAWANQGSSIGDGRPVDQWIRDEGDRILREYGNHPSFVMLAYGNEPGGKNQKQYLGDLVNSWKQKDPRRLYTSGAGWPIIPESQFHNIPQPRIQAWGAGLTSRINSRPPETQTDYRNLIAQYDVPVVSHEIGQWCVYPNFDEIAKYTGVLKPKNFEVFRDFLAANHMLDQARIFLMASGKLQTLCYKEEIESALRTPGFGGFQLLDLHDFPGQGTALVGVLDPFWDSKPYVAPAEFRRFCDLTVPLARLEKRVWTSSDTFAAHVEISHFGPSDLDNASVTWTLLNESKQPLASGRFAPTTIVTGQLNAIGELKTVLSHVAAAQKLKLIVTIQDTPFENDWDIWVYPSEPVTASPDDIVVSQDLDERTLGALKAGGKVLLLVSPDRVRTDVVIGFSSIFWNTAWTRNQAPHTLGILCDPKHPALAGFPTEYHSNWQWWELISRSAAMPLEGFPPDMRPVVQPIDTWFHNRRLGLVFEAEVAGGRLLVCSIDLSHDLDQRPAAKQMRDSLLRYMAGNQFQPRHRVTLQQIRSFLKPPPPLHRFRATVTADSQQPGYEAKNAIDGDPQTIWHTAWGESLTRPPHHLVIDLQSPRRLTGITYLPRQDMSNGRIIRYSIAVSDNAKDWGQPVASGTWPDGKSLRRIDFDSPQTGRYVKLEALASVNDQPHTSVAEIDVVAE